MVLAMVLSSTPDSGGDDRLMKFSVRCILLHETDTYEERITLWYAKGLSEAIAMAEEEVQEYAALLEARYLGFAQAYGPLDQLGPDDPYGPLEYEEGGVLTSGSELFSLMRTSNLPPDEYLVAYFATGLEIEGNDPE